MPDAGNRLTLPPGLSCLRKSAHLTPWPAACRHARSSQNARETIITIKNYIKKKINKSERHDAIEAQSRHGELPSSDSSGVFLLIHSHTLAAPRPLSPPSVTAAARSATEPRCREAVPQWHHLRVADDWDRHWIEVTVCMISVYRERSVYEPATWSCASGRPRSPFSRTTPKILMKKAELMQSI